MNINVFNCLITADPPAKKIYVASSKQDIIVLPVTHIDQPKFLFNEIRYNIKHLFAKDSIKFLEEIILSFIDIQNYLLLNLIDKSEDYKFIQDSDINLLCGIILHEKVLSDKLFWIEIPGFVQNYNIPNVEDTEMTQLIRYVFDKMIL